MPRKPILPAPARLPFIRITTPPRPRRRRLLPPVPRQSTQPFLPAVPMDQYLAQKAEIGKYSQSSFSFPAQLEVSCAGPGATRSHASGSDRLDSHVQLARPPGYRTGTTLSGPRRRPQRRVDGGQLEPRAVHQIRHAAIFELTSRIGLAMSSQPPARRIASCTIRGSSTINCTAVSCSWRAPRLPIEQNRTSSFLLLSVSNGATYDGGWKNWAMNASLDGSVVTQNWGDSWRLGFDNVAIYLSGNMYQRRRAFSVREDSRPEEIRPVQSGQPPLCPIRRSARPTRS